MPEDLTDRAGDRSRPPAAGSPTPTGRGRAAPPPDPLPRVLQYGDPARAAATLGRLLGAAPFALGRSSDDFSCRIVVGTCGALTVVTTRMDEQGWVDAAHATGVLVTAALTTEGATFTGGDRAPCRMRAGQVWRVDETADLHGTFDPGTTYADLVLPLPVVAAAAAGAGRDVAEDADGRPVLRFVGNRPLDDGAERYWAALTRAAAQQVAGPGGAPTSPLLRDHLVRTLAAAAPAVFPTVVVDHARGPGFTGPANLRRALEHLHAHAGEPVTAVELAAAAGIGVRALQQAFAQHLGSTPTAHLQQVRLERAHADLRAGDPTAGDSVTAVAARWGFSHHGRFAAAYRARYGVPPSATLRT